MHGSLMFRIDYSLRQARTAVLVGQLGAADTFNVFTSARSLEVGFAVPLTSAPVFNRVNGSEELVVVEK